MQSSINLRRKIGVEIEVVVPIVGRGENRDVQQLIAEILTNQGLRAFARNYSHAPLPAAYQFAIEHDMSLQDESRYQGLRWSKIEIKTAPMTWADLERTLPPALDVVRYVGARCNLSTGFHVHHHLPEVIRRPLIVRSLQNLWWRFHPILYGVVAPSRKTSQYCRIPQQQDVTRFSSSTTYDQLRGELNRCDRFSGLNLTNLTNAERRTVEWRIHSGTTDLSKIKSWVLATQRLIEHAVARNCHYKPEPIANTQAGLNALLTTTGLKPNSRIYQNVDKELRRVGKFLLRRWKHFNLPHYSKGKTVAA